MILWMVCYTYRFQFILFINYKKLIMKKNFIIFRHEKTDRPEQQTLSEWLKSGLNEEGSERSLVLADNLKQFGIELIYSSPRLRAYQTAELAGFKLGIPVYTDKRLDEINLGLLGDMTYDEISRYYPELWLIVMTAPLLFMMPLPAEKASMPFGNAYSIFSTAC